jgi:protein phosphatase
MQKHASGECSGAGLKVSWVSEVGRVRTVNEDACMASLDDGLLAVSDGMGGEHAGELASRHVVEWLPSLVAEHIGGLENPVPHDVELALRDAVLVLNHRLRTESSTLEGMSKMGATITMVLVRGAEAHIAHVGDSRAYLFRDGELRRLTRDHSVVGRLLESGAITEDQAECHPMRGQLSRYIGMGGNAPADVLTVALSEGDRLLLCSDGLTLGVTDEQIAAFLTDQDDLGAACRAMVDAAGEASGRDNITVLLAEWHSPS